MSSVVSSAPRHRSAGRASTPLSQFARTATSQIAVVGRRSAVVVATSGVAVGLVGAAPADAAEGPSSIGSVDTTAVAQAVKAALATAPVVSAPATDSFSLDAVAVSATKPAPAATPAAAKKAAKKSTSTTAAAASATAVSTSASASSADVPASVSGNAVLEIAARYVGVRYASGGSSPSTGFDCSGFVSYVYAQLGIDLPHQSGAIAQLGTRVSRADAQPGDIVWTPGHVAIYAGGNTMIDSPKPGGSVDFRSMWQSSPVFIRI